MGRNVGLGVSLLATGYLIIGFFAVGPSFARPYVPIPAGFGAYLGLATMLAGAVLLLGIGRQKRK